MGEDGNSAMTKRGRGAAYKNLAPGDARLAELDKNHAKVIFAQRLQAAMDAKGWNQSDLARAAAKVLGRDLGRDNISNYVTAKHLPGSAVLKAVANALGCQPTDLLPARTVPSAAQVAPPIDVRDLGDGYVFLRINKRVPWAKALEVLRMVQED